MTKLLALAFEQASRLPARRQDELAQTLLDDFAGESAPTETSAQKSEEMADGRLLRLVRKGWLTLPIAISQDPPPRSPVALLSTDFTPTR